MQSDIESKETLVKIENYFEFVPNLSGFIS